MRRIVEGLGLSLARRAAQSFCDSLPRASLPSFWRWGWPDGFPKKVSERRKAKGILDADSHGKPTPSHARAPLFWRWGLAPLFWRWGLARRASRNKFRKPLRHTRPEVYVATRAAQRTASLALASVVLALGVGPTGFPKQVSERCKAGESWTPTAMANPRRRTRALRYFGAGGWPVGLLETTFRATAEASATAMANPRRRTRALRCFGAGGWPVGLPETIFRATAKASATVVLALGVGSTGFPKQVSERCKAGGIFDADSHGKPAPSHARAPLFRRWGLARRASRNNLPGEASATAMATRAVARACSGILALGAGPSGFPKQVSERRKAGGSWRPPRHMRPEADVATRAAQIFKGEGQPVGRFHIAPYKEFISGQAEPSLPRAGKAICRFIKAGQPQRAFYQRRWPFYQGRPASIAVLATVAALSRPGQWPQWPVYHPEAAAWPDL